MSVASSIVAIPRPGDPDAAVLRFTVAQYHAMMKAGIVREGEPFELVDGRIVCKNRAAAGGDPMTIGERHAWAVIRLGKLSATLEPLGSHLRTQQPISIPPYDEPEPDGAIVLGTEDDYLDHKPTGCEVLCVIEVADSSLLFDRKVKARTYASAGLSPYVIVNLAESTVEVYRLADARTSAYGPPLVLRRGQSLSLPTATDQPCSVSVDRLLPPT